MPTPSYSKATVAHRNSAAAKPDASAGPKESLKRKRSTEDTEGRTEGHTKRNIKESTNYGAREFSSSSRSNSPRGIRPRHKRTRCDSREATHWSGEGFFHARGKNRPTDDVHARRDGRYARPNPRSAEGECRATARAETIPDVAKGVINAVNSIAGNMGTKSRGCRATSSSWSWTTVWGRRKNDYGLTQEKLIIYRGIGF